jgi:CheY-like chemotaxis protein
LLNKLALGRGDFDLSGTLFSAEKDMEERVRRADQEANRIERRENGKFQSVSTPVDLWLDSGYEDGGILVINGDAGIRPRIAEILKIRGYKVQEASNEREAVSAFRKANYNLMIVPWVMFEKSSDFVNFLRKAFPQTKIIITSPNFAWSSENMVGANRGNDALMAGAYSYVPDQHIDRSLLTCVESAMKSKEKSCPVLLAGLACNLLCRL